MQCTLDSRINVGQEINVRPEKFGKMNKRRALNNHRAWKVWQTFEVFVIFFRFFTLNLITIGPFNKAVGPGKNYKINKRRAYVYSRV